MTLLDNHANNDNLLAYTWLHGQEKIVVVINFCESDHIFEDNIEYQKVIFNIGKFDHLDRTQIKIYPLSGLVLSN